MFLMCQLCKHKSKIYVSLFLFFFIFFFCFFNFPAKSCCSADGPLFGSLVAVVLSCTVPVLSFSSEGVQEFFPCFGGNGGKGRKVDDLTMRV